MDNLQAECDICTGTLRNVIRNWILCVERKNIGAGYVAVQFFFVLFNDTNSYSCLANGGTMLTREDRNTRRETCSSTILSTTNSTWTNLASNTILPSEMPGANSLS